MYYKYCSCWLQNTGYVSLWHNLTMNADLLILDYGSERARSSGVQRVTRHTNSAGWLIWVCKINEVTIMMSLNADNSRPQAPRCNDVQSSMQIIKFKQQHKMCMRHTVICGLSGSTKFSPNIP